MLLLSTEKLFGAGPEPIVICSLVLAHKVFKPSGAAASVKLLASSGDGSKSVVSSAYTRSVKSEAPTWIPCFMDMCCSIQSMAMQKSAIAMMQPCLTPDDVWTVSAHWKTAWQTDSTDHNNLLGKAIMILHWFYWSVFLAHHDFLFCQRHLE